jgi:hypothetical protein
VHLQNAERRTDCGSREIVVLANLWEMVRFSAFIDCKGSGFWGAIYLVGISIRS